MPFGDICLAAGVIGKPNLQICDIRDWLKCLDAGFLRCDGKDPLRIPEVRERTMRNAEAQAEKVLVEVFRRRGIWARKHHLEAFLPCLSTTSP